MSRKCGRAPINLPALTPTRVAWLAASESHGPCYDDNESLGSLRDVGGAGGGSVVIAWEIIQRELG